MSRSDSNPCKNTSLGNSPGTEGTFSKCNRQPAGLASGFDSHKCRSDSNPCSRLLG